jgi:hypothetical protein
VLVTLYEILRSITFFTKVRTLPSLQCAR